MTDFIVSITDAAQLAGVTAALTAHNATADTPLKDEAAYVQYIVDNAAASYAQQFGPAIQADKLKVVLQAAVAANIEGAGDALAAIMPADIQAVPADQQTTLTLAP